MNILDAIAPILFLVGIASVIGMRLNRNQSATLVLQQFTLAVEPQVTPQPTVEIVGRMQGIVAFVLSLMGFSPISRFTIAGPEVRYQSSSLFGERSQFIPLRCVTTLAAGVHKPISMLVWAILIIAAGAYMSVTATSWAPIAIALIVGIVLIVLYFITKKFFIEVYSQGGPPILLLFKPNVLEGVPIDVDQALEVVGVIRDMILAEGAGAGTGGGTARFNHHAAEDDEYNEVIVDDDDQPQDSDDDDDERQAKHWFSQARQYSNAGQTQLAIATLQQLIRKFPHTTTAEMARRSLAKNRQS